MTWHRFRTARSVMVLAALIALPLVACGGGDDTDTETAEISGTTGDCLNVDGPWTGDPIGGLPGSVERGFTQDGEATTGVCSGTVTISNDGGTWEGTTEGTTLWTTSDPTHVHELDATFLGTGDYAGLRLVTHAEGTGTPWTLTGRIEPID